MSVGSQMPDRGSQVTFRGTVLGPMEFARIQRIIDDEPIRSREELARETCRRFRWRRHNGTLPIEACRKLLRRLHREGLVDLPRARRRSSRTLRRRPPELSPDFLLGPTPAWEERVRPNATLVVRPIEEQERLGWDAYMQRYHYLGNASLVGESLRYAAVLDYELVALLSFGVAAMHNGPRDQFIGWDAAGKWARLHLVVNNARFLILPWIRQRNLASRILAATVRRLSDDWEAVHGHRVLLAETFVDPSRFRGTCYRAASWTCFCETKGWSKSGAQYRFNGQPKAVFVYALARNARQLLCASPEAQAPYSESKTMELDIEKLPLDGAGGLVEVLRTVTDPRKRRGIRHKIHGVLALAICAALTGQKSIGAISEWIAQCVPREVRKRLGCRHGKPPSERTLRRVFESVDVEEIDAKTGLWVAQQREVLAGQGLALDAKTLRGSFDGDEPQVHLLSAVVHGSGVVVAQTRVPGKTNEITRVKPLLEQLDIAGAVVTADALLTQKEIARDIVENKGADYVFTVKDNQPTLRQDIEDLGIEASPPEHTTLDKGHGRIETREIWTSTALNDYVDFPYVRQVFVIRRTTTDLDGNTLPGRKGQQEMCFGVSSLAAQKATADRILAFNRGQWEIENRLHYVRDRTYDEDRSQVRRKNRPHAMASFRNVAISLMRLVGASSIAAATRHLNWSPLEALRLVGV